MHFSEDRLIMCRIKLFLRERNKKMNKKNAVIVGYGGMGGWHAKYFTEKNSDCVNLLGIWDIKEERRKAAEEKGIYAYSSLDEVLADERVDFITIATPNDVHKEIAVAAMKAGKHVISEKPVTLSSEDLEEMIAASEKYGKLFTTHQNRRWDADYLMIRDIYREGKLGKTFTVESRVQGSRGIPGDWRGEKAHGGGMILDWGVHLIDQMIGIIYDKKIKSVYCRCDYITNAEVDDGFKLDLYFEDGITARVEVGTNNFMSLPRFYMTGSSGAALIGDWKDDCHIVLCTEWNEDNVVPVVTAAGLTKTMAPRNAKTTKEEIVVRPTSDVHDFYRNFTAAIDGKATQLITHDQLRRSMKIMEAAFESDRLGRPVDFCDIDAPRAH